jgi:cytoskeleton protein RodZ
MSDFGITFKKAREAMGLTLDQVATETRIGTRFLEAIEKEEFHVLPGGIFSRGFVRSYAESVGLDTEKAVADFERLSNYRDPSAMDDLRVSTLHPGSLNRALYPIALAVLVILVIVVYMATRGSNTTVNASQPPASVIAPSPPPTATPAPQPPVAVDPQPAETEPPPATGPIAAATDDLTLEIAATEATWVKVLADGRAVVQGEVLHSGMMRRFTAKNSISLVVGNAGGITIKVNDHAIHALGEKGQVKLLTITPENLKSIIG